MKRINKFSFVLLILAVCLAVSAFTAAAETKGPQLFGYYFNKTDGTFDSLIYAKSDERLTKSNFSQKIGDAEYAPESLSTYSDSKYSTSWVVVIESLRGYRTLENSVRALINKIVEGMTGSDNLAIYTTYGDKYAFNSDKKTIDTIVSDTMRKQAPDTDKKLYDAVYSALQTLKTDSKLNEHRSLVIISEFVDTNSAHTFESVRTMAADFNGTIYVVGLTQNLLGNKQNFDSARVLADENPSGGAYTLDTVDDATGRSIADQIRNNEEFCRVLSTRLDTMKPAEGETPPVVVTMQTGNMQIDSNSLTVKSSDFNSVVSAEEGASSEDVTVITPEVVEGEEEENKNLKYYIGGAAAAILIAVVVFLLIRKNRKKPTPPKPPVTGTAGISGGTKPVSQVSKVTLTLTKVDTGEVFKGEITESSIKAGREQKLKLTGDPGISSSHMEFIWQSGVMYVQDTKSLNGTFVNKKKITGAVPLQQSDIIHAGSSDFRVNWKSNS